MMVRTGPTETTCQPILSAICCCVQAMIRLLPYQTTTGRAMETSRALLIGGRWQAAADGAAYEVVNPATEEVIGSAAQAGAPDVKAAIAAAEVGLASWRRTNPWVRSRVIRRISQIVEERREEIARLVTIEVGKPIEQSRGEVQATWELFDWFADETRRIYGQVIEPRGTSGHQTVTFEPVGIVAAFTAWNFPVLLMSRKIAPALAAGCSIICRPAEEAPGAVLAIARCCLDAGVPPGVVNVLTGLPNAITPAIMASPKVRKVTFTGSIPVGQMLMRQAADTVKRVTMELGGHAPVIVHDDVDVTAAAHLSAVAKFRNAGQVCASPTRFYVHESRVEAFAAAFSARAAALKVGDGLDPANDVGPLTTRRRREAVEAMVEDAVAAGGKLAVGGRRPAQPNRGWFYEPTAVVGAPEGARLMTEEPFGPVAAISGFSRVEEALERANGLEFGLAAYVFTNSLKRAHETSEALQAGVVCVNTYVAALAETPFGGTKQSGFGREGGALGIRDYLDAKFTNMAFLQ
ncbi:NAD-dependent succinate-semialdehyde dehydrogenase [Methylobacterium sp. NEAU 140]|uniref:NAD-dependent succinate-semialdehyde dehydrogenase n=1 Tax=Methylobacterium sp. NEAU 140 TaxID=3064945 RepID=UPI00273682FB|nr:NAD-dependent succinate-semialdehyde dehydrogenase [Methylobacterium sp. NEAU 140]MDP4026156.1 NAD-dependent succinate-semialdehyde dehydrogenase [Methylobacterium sp. NEAU 140]